MSIEATENKPMAVEFKEWPKTARHFRDITVTEKIDGTNSALHITPDGQVQAQSRNRLIYPTKSLDNYGFATWAEAHAEELATLLGPGVHYGEWWGNGIQRGYGQAEKHFWLFNTRSKDKIHYNKPEGLNIGTVPVLYQGVNDTNEIRAALIQLRDSGSVAAPGFMNPEGVCIYHSTLRTISKVTLDNNDAGKWEAA
jgi:hypothetical protein